MDPDFLTQLANSVLDDFNLFDPPGLTRMEHVIHSYKPYEPVYETESKLTKLINMKTELDKLLISTQEKITNINKLIEEESNNIFAKPTPEFTDAVYALLSRESPIRSSSIPHKLPKNVLPPINHKGLFTSWMNQLINIKKQHVKDGSQEYDNYSLIYPILEYQYLPQINTLPVAYQKTKKYKVCWQKNRGKPCNNLDEYGNCKFCSK
jgi:hypothetical protein